MLPCRTRYVSPWKTTLLELRLRGGRSPAMHAAHQVFGSHERLILPLCSSTGSGRSKACDPRQLESQTRPEPSFVVRSTVELRTGRTRPAFGDARARAHKRP